jgi:LPPG:FO 2-phospho-L-lactate transferase
VSAHILALAGGVGGAKLSRGLADQLAPESLTIAVNTGDDFEHLGFSISPDLDTVMYTLAGLQNPQTGWGIAGDTFHCMSALDAAGGETWFRLGDQDLATHIERTRQLARGSTLSEVTARLCRAHGVGHRIVPMSDDAVRTLVHTDEGTLAFQDYFVRRRAEPRVARLEYAGAASARLSAGFEQALIDPQLAAVVICPSNPHLSIAPLLALADLRRRLAICRVPVVAVSPIIGGEAVKGPAAKLMRELGTEPSALAVARFYEGLIDGFVFDQIDAAQAEAIGELGIAPCVASTIMTSAADRTRLAERVLSFADGLRVSATEAA